MERCTRILFILLLSFGLVSITQATERAPFSRGGAELRPGRSERPDARKTAAADSVILIGPWGSGAVVNGQFEDPAGNPSWQGWYSRDMTERSQAIWHADTYNVVAGQYSAWCGELSYPACVDFDPDDPAGGYGSNYDESLVWRATVADPLLPAAVTISATVNHDTEPAYDYAYLAYYKGEDPAAYLWSTDGKGDQVPVSGSVTYLPGEYLGEGGNEVRIAWRVMSDGGWDDSDCAFASEGALQVDNVTVSLEQDGQVNQTYDDFEDGTLGNWSVEFAPGVGDYCHLLQGLGDEDPCSSNYSPQACFVADQSMYLERGLPTQFCQTWCYGPGGYIVNTRGGAAGPEYHMNTILHSPVIDWPAGYYGARFEFDVYRHEDLSADAPGMFYVWGTRSAAVGDDISEAPYEDRNFVFYGGPSYLRDGQSDVSYLFVPDPAQVQVWFQVLELGCAWGWDGDDGYPAPYFDNVHLVASTVTGPSIAANAIELAQDGFPVHGHLDEEPSHGLNDVRFDMARNIAPVGDLRNDPGDSIVVSIFAGRDGAELVDADIDQFVTAPRLYFTLSANPRYGEELRLGVGQFTCDSDGPVVVTGEITSIADGVISGYVRGGRAVKNGITSPDHWMFDLPDADFLYPGDALHYYIEAWDQAFASGSGWSFRQARLPEDLSGFGDFSDLRSYDPDFTVRALPSVSSGGMYWEPSVLYWDDSGDPGIRDVWLENLYLLGARYWPLDVYTTRGPSSGVGNGLGGRATVEQLAAYDIIVYSCGDQTAYTITDGDFNQDAGDDLGVLAAWLDLGDRGLFAAGDNLASDLWNSSAAGRDFAIERLGVSVVSDDARPLLGGDAVPIVHPTEPDIVGYGNSWVMLGGCPELNRFDAVIADYGTQAAHFNDGSSGLAALTLHTPIPTTRVISMVGDLAFVGTEPNAGRDGQNTVLEETLCYLGRCRIWGAVDDAPPAVFSAGAHPNPFNPSTRIEYNLPRAGHLLVRVFDVRGRAVRTLRDEPVAAGAGHVVWDGTDGAGQAVASGVYFYEVRAGQDTKIDKLMLLK